MHGMRATAFAITILAVSVSASTIDRAYNIDAMASNQPHAVRAAARLLDPPPTPELYMNIYVIDSALASQ